MMKITLTFSEAIGAADRTKFTFDSGGTTLDTTGSAVIDADTKLTVTITLDTALTASDTNVTVALAADAVEDAVGNGNAVLAATPIVDETAPTLSETSTPSNTEVLLTYNEPLDPDFIPAASAFTAVVNTGSTTRDRLHGGAQRHVGHPAHPQPGLPPRRPADGQLHRAGNESHPGHSRKTRPRP